MKNFRNLLLFLLPLVFASCMDTREELEIKGDGSGTLVMKTDLSKMLELVKGFAGETDLAKDGLDRPYDTSMILKDYIDTARDVPADQKELLRNGKVHIVMNVKESIGKFDMTFPFTSTDQLQQLYASLNSSTGGLKGMFDGMGKNLPKGPDEQSNDKGISQIASVYDIVVKNGLYSRKVNKERYDAFMQAMKLDELKQMASMFGAMDYTLSVKLPGKIKTVSNSKALLSDDKKTVTLKTDLMETFQHPELLALDITY
ncbi:MAG: hypothetical protein NVSMB7_10540 [Chitinophagaceae bacterium]